MDNSHLFLGLGCYTLPLLAFKKDAEFRGGAEIRGERKKVIIPIGDSICDNEMFIVTPAAGFYLFTVQDMTGNVGELVQSSLIFFLLFPGLTTIASWLRGLLINYRVTSDVNVGMGLNMGVTAVVLGVGLWGRFPGLPTAAVALNIALFCEIGYLAWRTQRMVPINLFHRTGWNPKPTI